MSAMATVATFFLALALLGYLITLYESMKVPAKAVGSAVHDDAKSMHGLVSAVGTLILRKMESTAVVRVAEPKAQIEVPPLDPRTAVEPAVIEIVPIGRKASVTLWFYQKEGKVNRRMRVIHPALAKRLGNTVKMDDITFTGNLGNVKLDLIRRTIADCKALLDSEKLPQKPAATPKAVQNIQPEAPVETKAQVVEESQEPSLPKEEVKPEEVRRKAKAVYRGKLAWHGFGERASGNSTYKQYRLDYVDSETQLVESVWGVDLRRAISVSGAKEGDMIEIMRLGKRQLDEKADDGETKSMIRWHIVKLPQK